LSGRITALADVYDALSNERPYKDAWPNEEVMDLIRSERGKHFDPDVVDAFFRLVEKEVL
ncbi:MAG: HD domain-containing phosphohydrolase, partial [Candidatus Thiodiazotropha endolucinida]